MDVKYNEPRDTSTTSLHGLYTDFDGWVTRFTAQHYKKSTCLSQETSTMDLINTAHQNDAIIEKDYVFRNLLARHRHTQHTARKPWFGLCKDHEGFIFYDHVFYGLLNKNGDRRIVYQIIRSKL
ncbi:uncharacterized protein LOC113492371 [Trichoplusia ni]|uniref:Uncharacterized protein LOC113492371 n=1 Tax=Trichoplusia ni TaxID=7111 RepID=A0A7E5VBJ2_TRINI|nr:uncharacterized protein LOC113492371 [Trichoplusia ni]